MSDLNDTQEVVPAQATEEVAQEVANPESDAKTESTEETTKRHISGIQSRINELTRQRHEERERREAAERRAYELEQYLQQQRMASSEPQPEQFNDYNDFVRAQAKFEAETHANRVVQEQLSRVLPQMNAQHQVAQARQAEQVAIGTIMNQGKAAYPDFEEVIESAQVDISINPAVKQAVLASRNPHLSYYLAKNPLEAQEIVASDPMTAVMKLGQIMAKVQNKRVSNAPPPPSTVGGSRSPVQKPEWEMSPKEWKAYMDKKGK